MAKEFKKIEELRALMASLNNYLQFERSSREDKSKVVIFEYDGEVKTGEFYLSDCIGNTVDLCIATDRKFKNPDGRMVYCKVVETLIADARVQLGSPVNGVWAIPKNL